MNDQMPIVTIGMPVFNEEKYLETALNSILNQSYQNIRVIISDNQSNDGTPSILRDFLEKDSRVIVYRQKNQIGPYENFKFVRDKADTEYFMWHAGDDYLEPNFVSELLHTIMKTPGAVCVMSDVKVVNEEGDYLHTLELNSIRKKSKINLLNTIQFFKNPTDAKYMCFYGIFETRVIKGMDLELGGNLKFNRGSEIPQLAQIALQGNILSIPHSLKVYRYSSNSLFTSEEKNMASFRNMLLNYLNLQNCLYWVICNSGLKFRHKIPLYVFITLYPFYYAVKKIKKMLQ